MPLNIKRKDQRLKEWQLPIVLTTFHMQNLTAVTLTGKAFWIRHQRVTNKCVVFSGIFELLEDYYLLILIKFQLWNLINLKIDSISSHTLTLATKINCVKIVKETEVLVR